MRRREAPESRLIVVVDDDGAVCNAISNLLESGGFQARSFHSVDDFLQSELLGHTACLILDVRMPGLSGLDLQTEIVQCNLSIPIIFITAHADEGAREQAMQAGAVAFLSKPFSADVLLSAVRSTFESSGD